MFDISLKIALTGRGRKPSKPVRIAASTEKIIICTGDVNQKLSIPGFKFANALEAWV